MERAKKEEKKQNIYHIPHLESLADIAKELIHKSQYKIWFFYGDLGAGKTTLIKLLCKELGVKDLVSSPTYALINEYQAQEDIVVHMDLYRLKSEEEAFDIGIEDYLYGNNYCFIEWPQVLEGFIDGPFHNLTLTETVDGSRKLIFE